MSVIQSTIDGRYQVVTRIAAGGMGEVYRAHDAVLGREVALKVLHPHLAGDRGFVERFRREARAAAILNHPNIVGVYDWGTTDGTYFMIMEFVRGTNLRAVLTQYRRLEPAQVVEVALPVLAALEHAHGHGIVHRDIKPENILIAEDGTLKVADFGLARAYADSYVSQAEGTVTGTVQYLAPEQIRGEPADPRTDIYAIGVVMFESLTGQPPFAGETSLAIAYQHLSAEVRAPSLVAPTATPALDSVVLRATAKDPDQRPPSARAMRDEIRSATAIPEATPLRQLVAQMPSDESIPAERATTVTIPRAVSPRKKRLRRVAFVASVLAILTMLGVGGWAVWTYAVPHYTHVPDVRGLSVAQATAALRRAGLPPPSIANAEFSHSVRANFVIRSVPPPHARIRTNAVVTLVPSAGPQYLDVPDVVGDTEAVATAALTRAGFTPEVQRDWDETTPEGRVSRQDAQPNHPLERGSKVTITVSKGPAPVKIPDLKGQPANEATAILQNLGFTVSQAEAYSTDVPKGDVIKTDPSAGTKASKGSSVTITVSLGPKTFKMPDVRNMTKEAATQLLESKGLTVDVVPVPSIVPPDTVVFQDPNPGTTVQQGQVVTIYVTGT